MSNLSCKLKQNIKEWNSGQAVKGSRPQNPFKIVAMTLGTFYHQHYKTAAFKLPE